MYNQCNFINKESVVSLDMVWLPVKGLRNRRSVGHRDAIPIERPSPSDWRPQRDAPTSTPQAGGQTVMSSGADVFRR